MSAVSRVNGASGTGTGRAVVFDFGGVVFRWRPLELLQEVLPQRVPDEEAARELAASIFQSFDVGSDWAAFDRGTIAEDDLVARISARTRLPAQEVHRVVDAIPTHLEAQAPTVELMRRLKAAGYRLFYLSNMPLPYAEHLERSHAFFAWFEGGIFSSRVQLIKPEPAIFAEAARRFGIVPADSVFIDDHPGNVEIARAEGWQSVQFTDVVQCEADLRSAGWVPAD
ncbi:HAD family phosphatase [Aquabacterium sp. A7-Y]|uniref:HAD family hydrolase n=1 Tax=Aquabacterium sp. A7-Y TaxID=1349605 RepID=UPI00223E4478|nr:HAD family phosphatase [Aquabacterium sp. A7-Y]MCW7539040.1 HAD family phosphatase [Aquabacterium sp. A7-Y]